MFSFIHIEKTAGITINHLLRRSFGIRHFDIEPRNARDDFVSKADLQALTSYFPFIQSIAGHKIKPYSDLASDKEFKFYTFLREPLQRCASQYQYQVQVMDKQLSFDQWINLDRYHNFQTKKIAGQANVDQAFNILNEKVFFVGLLEKFDESLLLMKRMFQPKKIDIRYTQKNVARDDSIKNSIFKNSRKRKMLERANELDVELYEYVKNSIFEAQVNSYKGDLENDIRLFKNNPYPPTFSLSYTANVCLRNIVYKPLWRSIK